MKNTIRSDVFSSKKRETESIELKNKESEMMTESDKLFSMMKYCDERNPKSTTIAMLIDQLQGYLEYLQRINGGNIQKEDQEILRKGKADHLDAVLKQILSEKMNSTKYREQALS